MKRLLIWLCIGLATAPSLHAQLIRSYGAKVAYTSANQKWEYTHFDGDHDRRSGMNAAVYVEWLNLPLVSVVTQLEYVQRGMQFNYSEGSELGPGVTTTGTLSNRVDYLSIPVMGKLRLPFGGLSPYVVAGPRIDFLVGKKTALGYNVVYDKFKNVNTGATVGVGTELHLPLLFTVSAEGRYNMDLADSYSTDALKIRNNSFDLWLGIGF